MTSTVTPAARKPLAALLIGVLAVCGLPLAMARFYLTIPHESIGRINDFLTEAQPSLFQLYHGHVADFLRSSPAYVGSLILRAPFAIAAMSAHASWQAIYGVTAVPCVLAAPILGWWLLRLTPPHEIDPRWVWLSPFGLLLVVNPVFIYALVEGHPEDVLGASVAIAGVVMAARDRPGWAMLLVALATVNKTWALIAVPVALAVLPGRHVRAVGVLVGVLVVVYAPIIIIRAHGLSESGSNLGSASSGIFLFPQLWWWFGRDSWIAGHAHEVIILTACLCSFLWRVVRGGDERTTEERQRDALRLLALVFLLRAAMDPWDNIYYHLPFLMAVAALEVGRKPILTLAMTLAVTAIVVPLHDPNFDLRAVIYQCGAVGLIGVFAVRVFASPGTWQRLKDAAVSRERSLWRPRVA